MSALRTWVGSWPVAVKLGAILAIALLTVGVLSAVGVTALNAESRSAKTLERINGMTRHALEADMAHDALRGDVLRALLAASGGGTAVSGGSRADVTEHGAILREAMVYFAGADMAPAVRRAAATVAPLVESYVKLSEQTVDAALAGNASPPTYGDFESAFAAVEQGLPAISDALGAEAAAASSAVDREHDLALLEFLVTGVAGLLLIALVCWLVARTVLSSLREVSGVLSAMADGDLRREARVGTTDEVGRMADTLNRATVSIRGTIASLSASSGTVAGTAEEFRGASQRIADAANAASDRAASATYGAQEVSRNIVALAAGSEEMGRSIAEISRNASEALRVASNAVIMAQETNTMMGRLSDSSVEIGNVVKVITSIAGQTNLLALNATIEAARAGDAGRGFAVVAGEVKDLAQETARATQDIARRVDAIQADATLAVDAIAQIGEIIARVNDFQVTIASAVEEQTASMGESSRTVTDVSRRGEQIAVDLGGLVDVAAQTTAEAGTTRRTAEQLAEMAVEMRALVTRFSCS
jgi:methyl-accepting chemotaxis protein